MPSPAPDPTPKRLRPSLTREEVARSALALADREGLEALSMRRLAGELGVGTMTLYGYFRNKEELLDAIVEVAAEEIHLTRIEGDWREQLRAIAREIHRLLSRHPAGVRIRFTRPMLTPGALRVTELAMESLQSGGLGPGEAARAYRTVFVYTFGYASFATDGPPGELERQTTAALRALPTDKYPAITAAPSELAATMRGDDQFEWGLERILDGIEEIRRAGPLSRGFGRSS